MAALMDLDADQEFVPEPDAPDGSGLRWFASMLAAFGMLTAAVSRDRVSSWLAARH